MAMLMRRLFLLAAIALGFCGCNSLLGQNTVSHSFTIPMIAIMDIEPSGSKNLEITLTVPTEAGLDITSPQDNSNWINYSSCVASGTSNKIMAQLTGGDAPSGTSIRLQVGNYSGVGAGTFGSSAGTVTVTSIATNVITAIGGSYTGTGINNGHRLTYFLQIDDYSLLRSATYPPVTITFTMSAN